MRIQKTTATFFVVLAGALPTIGAVPAGLASGPATSAPAVVADGGVDWREHTSGDVVLALGGEPTVGGVDWGFTTDGRRADGGVDW